jgi:hypothetical protein
MSNTPAHDWLRPRLAALVHDAERAGFDRQTVIAVLTDLITAPPYNPPDQMYTPFMPPAG